MIGFVVLFMFVVSTTLAIYKPPLKWVSGCLIVYVPMWHHQLTNDFVSQIRIQVSNPIIFSIISVVMHIIFFCLYTIILVFQTTHTTCVFCVFIVVVVVARILWSLHSARLR